LINAVPSYIARPRSRQAACNVRSYYEAKRQEEYVRFNEGSWAPFPDAFSTGGITWKLLHVSPEVGTWTAIFDCPPGSSSFSAHFHTGPGEYLFYKGKMEVRGGSQSGGNTAIAPVPRYIYFC
jgi:acetylacetone-cleaving enzyme